MTHSYSRRSLLVLALLGILSSVMSVLSVVLLFQLQAQRSSIKDSPTFVSSEVISVLLPVSTVFSAFSLTLNLGSLLVCLLHSYLTNEICRGTPDTLRADWFLLDSRAVRHMAVGLFCLGVSVYLAAMSIYMLLVFEIETGIAGACVLAAGVLFMLLIVINALIQATVSTKRFRKEHPHGPYQMDPISPSRNQAPRFTDQPRRQHSLASVHAHFSNPATVEAQQYSPSNVPRGHPRDRGGYSDGGRPHRTHRTYTNEFIEDTPWSGVNSEMRSVLARKATVKDSTLV